MAVLSDYYIGQSKVFNITGWSGPARNCNPCIRFSTTPQKGDKGVLDRLVCEGGGQGILRATAQTSNEIDYPANFVWDKVILMAHARAYKALIISHRTGISARNIYGFVPNIPEYSNPLTSLFVFDSDNPSPGLSDEPVTITGCTLVDLRNDSYGSSMSINDGDLDFGNLTVENNIIYQPNRLSGITSGLNLDSNFENVSLIYMGVRYNYNHIDFNPGIVGNGDTFSIPYPNTRPHPSRGHFASKGSDVLTDQRYWHAISRSDIRHRITIGSKLFLAERGEFTVEFRTFDIVITNTSGSDWNEKRLTIAIRLDRSSLRESELPLDTRFASSKKTVPVPRPSNSSLYINRRLGHFPYDDLLGNVRPSSSQSMGAVQFL